jgi:hypothetical protein
MNTGQASDNRHDHLSPTSLPAMKAQIKVNPTPPKFRVLYRPA